MDDKEAIDILALDMSKTSMVTDYFVICTANSTVHMKALLDTACAFSHDGGYKLIYADRQVKGDWALVDMGEIIVHIFSEKGRKYYALEELWREADRVNLR